MKHLAWIWLLLLLASCGSPEVATSQPTPVAINIYYPASLQAWADRLASCAENDSQVALFFFQPLKTNDPVNPNDILLELGEPSRNAQSLQAYQVGWEQVVVIVNKVNPMTQASAELLRQIFQGSVLIWDNATAKKIQVWVMPEGEPIRQIFDNVLKLTPPLAADAMLAPNPAAILQAVSKDENAIGYLPQSFLNSSSQADKDKVKPLLLVNSLELELHQPVISFTVDEPTGVEREILVCLQKSGSD